MCQPSHDSQCLALQTVVSISASFPVPSATIRSINSNCKLHLRNIFLSAWVGINLSVHFPSTMKLISLVPIPPIIANPSIHIKINDIQPSQQVHQTTDPSYLICIIVSQLEEIPSNTMCNSCIACVIYICVPHG